MYAGEGGSIQTENLFQCKTNYCYALTELHFSQKGCNEMVLNLTS